ncbi:MAG TPA: metallophosphoesterase [Thermoanaerobaculia bacterium]|nr:metallophosphoesterase [Thermoanaerobaculia bacterium]
MSDPRHRLRILHISDLHERGPREKEPWRRRRVLGDAWERNLAEVLQDGPVDLVCFTGDAADWGLEKEYGPVTDFFTALLDRLHLKADRLFVIPGNHDIERPIYKDEWASLRELAPQVDRLQLARWMTGGSTPLGLEDDWRDGVLTRQSAYRRWVRESLGRPELDPERSPHGRLGYRATVEIPGWGLPIQILGLDTAWLCGDDHDTGRLWLTDDQLMKLASDPKGDALPGLRLVLMHHPFQDLADGAHCRKLLAGRVDLVLRGHLHEQTVETWADPDRTVRQLAAGCLYEGDRADHYANACQVVTIGLDDTGRPLQIDLRFRAFSPGGGYWHDDDSLYAESRGGRLAWIFPRPAAPRSTIRNPYDPWNPAVPPRFVGRDNLRLALGEALQKNNSVSLVGSWLCGKSSLLRFWHDRQTDQRRTALLLSGDGSEGSSEAAFVGSIIGRSVENDPTKAAEALSLWSTKTATSAQPPLLLIDKFDRIAERFDAHFLDRIGGMLGKIVLVVSSRQEELCKTSPFDSNKFMVLWVGLLEPLAAEELISWGGTLLGPDGVALMRSWAGRHPYYLQLLGYHLIQARINGERLDAGIDRSRGEAAVRLRTLWGDLAPREKEGLLGTLSGRPTQQWRLRMGGLVTEEGLLFGEVLKEWLQEEI